MICCKSIDVGNFTGAMVDNLMPKICVAPAFLLLQLLHSRYGRFPAISDYDSFGLQIEKAKTIKNLSLAPRFAIHCILRVLQNTKEETIWPVGYSSAPDPDLIRSCTGTFAKGTTPQLVQVRLINFDNILVLLVEGHSIRNFCDRGLNLLHVAGRLHGAWTLEESFLMACCFFIAVFRTCLAGFLLKTFFGGSFRIWFADFKDVEVIL
jgi:hypothetical protein